MVILSSPTKTMASVTIATPLGANSASVGGWLLQICEDLLFHSNLEVVQLVARILTVIVQRQQTFAHNASYHPLMDRLTTNILLIADSNSFVNNWSANNIRILRSLLDCIVQIMSTLAHSVAIRGGQDDLELLRAILERVTHHTTTTLLQLLQKPTNLTPNSGTPCVLRDCIGIHICE
jgi:hypothetical protein